MQAKLKHRPRDLDNAGIIVKAADVNLAYAASVGEACRRDCCASADVDGVWVDSALASLGLTYDRDARKAAVKVADRIDFARLLHG